MNRTFSCTAKDDVLARAYAFLTRNGYDVSKRATLVRKSLEIIAAQLGNDEPTSIELVEYETLMHGTRVTNTPPPLPALALNLPPRETRSDVENFQWWEQLGCVNAVEGEQYTNYLAACDKTTSEVTVETWRELRIRATERELEQNIERETLRKLAEEAK